MPLLIATHLLAAVVWIGGMAFSLFVLGPATAPVDLPLRVAVWFRVLSRFLTWAWVAVVTLLVTGYGMIHTAFGGFSAVGPYIHVMHLLAWAMFIVLCYLYFVPFRRLQHMVKHELIPEAGLYLMAIRRLVAVNFGLGMVTIFVASSGRYL
ncbi:MAG: CopD family protein [Magnetococcales bacterium]|nr:CopD family protein [Magnetococcales bacterium]